MKCDYIIKYVEKRRASGPYKAIDKWFSRSWLVIKGEGPFGHDAQPSREELLAAGGEVCDGNIEVSINAEEEPYMGGCSAVLDITYRCSKCSSTYYPHLPQNGDELSSFVQKTIAESDSGPLIANTIARYKKEEARRQEMIDFLEKNKKK